ncbi:MAG: hypothetical protein ACI9UA_002365, partial [Pseudoalteromonas tetraodonis]
GSKLKLAGMFVFKLLVGAFFCCGMFGILGPLSVIGAILAVGWTYRLMQRSALKVWWVRSPEWYAGVRFQTLTSTNDEWREHMHWPNWFRGRRVLSSLVQNFKIGLRGVFNSYVLTVIPGLIWFLTWEAGWDNSFNFGYEQSFVNPSRYIVGMFAFIAVMFYLPMAQARQAVTGDWRSFYDFRIVRKLVRRRWLGSLTLAACYGGLSLPVMAMKVAPYFMTQENEAFLELSAVEMLRQFHSYLFLTSLFVFPAFVFLHVIAARLYAGAVRDALQAGELKAHGFEVVAVEKLHIDVPDPGPERSAPTRFILWAGSFTGRLSAGFLAVLIWFGFTFQIVVGQFVKFEAHPVKGWINQPLVQMPWFDLMPAQLKKQAREERQSKRK